MLKKLTWSKEVKKGELKEGKRDAGWEGTRDGGDGGEGVEKDRDKPCVLRGFETPQGEDGSSVATQ